MSTKNNAAARLHAIADELGCAPELVAATRSELKLRRWADVRDAVIERLSIERAKAETDEPDSPSEPSAVEGSTKERKASLTLSQRRALLRLMDNGSVAPATAFKALPYEHLVGCGYATVAETDGDDTVAAFTLTAKGRERAESINPGYRVWSAGETVAGDPTRPSAGTHKVVEAGKLV